MKFQMCANDALMCSWPMAGVWRWIEFATPGTYRVIFCVDHKIAPMHFDAVVDDFGDLVRVP